jgi:predicted acylesterase/phospholipase RssA
MATNPSAQEASRSIDPGEGKVGLALSGGGFRAAFFHVGVLARLAELGVLPRVEVISTVSGGSIVGAAYYLVLKNRLEDTSKGAMTRTDYVDVVHTVERKLLYAVRKNIRGRVFANPVKTVSMALPRYSRSNRIGDLYDRYLYKEIWKERPNGSRERKWWGAERQIAMHELAIKPHVTGINPPILWINATSLNSGHNWRFGTCAMGEPSPRNHDKAATVKDVDKNVRLVPGRFEENPGEACKKHAYEYSVGERQKDFPLALAVAASACVPLLFHPLSISGMYKGYRVELVDGGVQDNQGIQGLLDEDCKYLIISDASGQMDDLERPSTLLPWVAGRTMSIYGDRIRDEQLAHACADDKVMALLHLRKGLVGKAVTPGSSLAQLPERHGYFPTEDFGVNSDVQGALSRIRTDLDYFGDSEAFSLMLDGYLMSDRECESQKLEPIQDEDAPDKNPSAWDFGNEDLTQRIAMAPAGKYGRQLKAGSKRFFRTIAMYRPERPWNLVAEAIAGLAVLAVLVWQAGAIGDAMSDVWRDQWSAKAVIVATSVPMLLLIAYLAMAIQRRPLRYLVALLWVLLLIAPSLILWVWRRLALPGRRLAKSVGKAPVGASGNGESA